MAKKTKTVTVKVGRSAITGRFTTVRRAVSRPRTHVVHHIKVKRGK